MTGADWTHFPHEADVGIRGYGATMAEAFENAARAMIAVMAPLDTILPRACVTIEAEAPDPGILLVDWLNGLIFEMATRRMLFAAFRVTIQGGRLRGEAWGEPVDRARHAPAVELKGATLTGLDVAAGPDGRWRAQCVIDV